MKSSEQDNSVQICLSIVFSLAVVAVVVYMLTGSAWAIYAGLGIYAFSFSLVSLFSIRRLFVVASYKERLKLFEAKADMSEDERIEYESKKQATLKLVNKTRTKELIKAIIFGGLAIFAVVSLVLF